MLTDRGIGSKPQLYPRPPFDADKTHDNPCCQNPMCSMCGFSSLWKNHFQAHGSTKI
ncbi:hypothetical protein BN341_1150 [Helicobacter heilmannii ASB1.4]|uniref:Uncharacterized protein n=1 Tax=Helicobacter heilmannii TaxID=35817 RepID=A0A0K2Y726_HELHE|nr:hypothetical protein BN341_1150 [Helicobacter heilmannii ASB1.4]CRI33922.1 hypothetical protein HHE01_16080 [Helicobacter heilmannii]